MSVESKTDDSQSADNMRKHLKVKMLQLRTDELQKKMDMTMDDLEAMTHEYATLMRELQELEEVNSNQSKKHINLLSRMIGEKKNTPVDYNSCNTSEEMLHMVMKELDQVKELEKNIECEKALPDVGDNSEIWDRIANAQRDAQKQEMSNLTLSPLHVATEVATEVANEPESRCPTPVSESDDVECMSDDLGCAMDDVLTQSVCV